MSVEHDELRAALRSLLGRQPANLWSRLCGEIGVAGLSIPERFGGTGFSLVESCLVLEELGRGLTPAPLLGSAVLAAQALLLTGNEEACARLLPAIADGGSTAALLWTDESGREIACAASSSDRVSGIAHYVLDGSAADVLLALAHTPSGIALYEVDPASVRREPVVAMDLTRSFATITVDTAARPIGPVDLDRLHAIACVALAAEQVGAAERALELTVEYTQLRVQFGRTIASFQALQHRMADMHVLARTARAAYLAALASLPSPSAASVAKVHCSDAFTQIAAEMIQLHGGIGITWEHDAHRYFKRAWGSAQLFGSAAEHVSRLGLLLDEAAH